MSVHELMAYYGFEFRTKCSCDGFVTEKWRKDNYLFEWRKYRYTFRLKQGKETLQTWRAVKELENYLNEVFKKYIPAKA